MIPALSFRIKLLGAMLLLVVGITGATLYVSQKKSQEFFKELFTEFFRNQNSAFTDKQRQILDGIKMNCATLVRSVRLQFALPEAVGGESEGLYRSAKSELETRRIVPGISIEANAFYATFYLFLDTNGEVIPPPESFPQLRQFTDQKKLTEQLKKVGHAMREMTTQLVGFVTLESSGDAPRLQQAVFTPVIDTKTDEILGTLVLGFPMPDLGKEPQGEYKFKAGIHFQGRIYSQAIPEALRETLAKRVARQTQLSSEPPEDFMERIGGDPNRIFYQALNPDPHFPPAYLVALLSVSKEVESQRDLRGKIFLFGGLGLVGALFLSLLLSHGFSAPIEELVKGTAEIQRGNFEVNVPVRSRDEIGRLTASFNEMAIGLALKEKYRSVLDKVTDKAVAEELMKGAVKLGGEQREISVLFCDIRGFTALSQGMDPAEVIFMLNEHFTPLTRVVKEHRGFVDKFVGDLIMAVFGAPKSHGNDAYDAARCALDMIHVREKLNEMSKYQIKVGIGVATGPALAGNMGSTDRLNYTVLGERVNLASRLCGKAGRMEVVIDETTQLRLKDLAIVEPLPELELKGFSARVQAYKLTDLRSTPTQV